jgi:hypothetical protein
MTRKPIAVRAKKESFDLADEVSALRESVETLNQTVTEGFQEIKSSLADILSALEGKDVS